MSSGPCVWRCRTFLTRCPAGVRSRGSVGGGVAASAATVRSRSARKPGGRRPPSPLGSWRERIPRSSRWWARPVPEGTGRSPSPRGPRARWSQLLQATHVPWPVCPAPCPEPAASPFLPLPGLPLGPVTIRGTLKKCVGAALGDQTHLAQRVSHSRAPTCGPEAAASPRQAEGEAHVRPCGSGVQSSIGRPRPGPAPRLSASRPRLPSRSERPHQQALRGPGPSGALVTADGAAVLVCRAPRPPPGPPGASRFAVAPSWAWLRASPGAPGGRGGLAGGRPLSVPCLPFASQPAHHPCPRCPGSAVHVGAAQWAQWLRWDPGLRGVSAGTCPGQGQGHEGARLTLGADAASAAPRQVTTDLRQRCTDGHTGTSVSAPMAAGIIALALEAK